MISRGEGKNTVAIALSQADPLVENVSVFLSSALYTLGAYEPENYIIRGLYPYSVSLYCIESSLWFLILTIVHLHRKRGGISIDTFDHTTG